MGTRGPVVSFHAHPTTRPSSRPVRWRAPVAEGHRVVLVLATSGESGLARGAPDAEELGRRRGEEFRASAAAIGARWSCWATRTRDGLRRPGARASRSPRTWTRMPLPRSWPRSCAEVLTSSRRTTLATATPTTSRCTGWARSAARLTGTRSSSRRRWTGKCRCGSHACCGDCPPSCRCPACPAMEDAFTARAALTHRVEGSTGRWRRRSGRCVTPATGADRGVRTVALLLRLPAPCVGGCWGPSGSRGGRPQAPGAPLIDDVFASLRRGEATG